MALTSWVLLTAKVLPDKISTGEMSTRRENGSQKTSGRQCSLLIVEKSNVMLCYCSIIHTMYLRRPTDLSH